MTRVKGRGDSSQAPWKFLSCRLPRKYLASAKEREPPLISALFSISPKTLYFATRNRPPSISSFSRCVSLAPWDPQIFRGLQTSGEPSIRSMLLPFVFRGDGRIQGAFFVDTRFFVRFRVSFSLHKNVETSMVSGMLARESR